MSNGSFSSPLADTHANEEGAVFAPRFDAAGLVTAVVTDARDGHLLMVAHMNAQSLRLTLETGIAHYWSRSRQELWVKGATSGHTQAVREVRLDCDGDTVLVKVDQTGGACHTGDRTCFDADLVLGAAS